MLLCDFVLFVVSSLLLWWSRHLLQNHGGGDSTANLDGGRYVVVVWVVLENTFRYILLHYVQDCTWPLAVVCKVKFLLPFFSLL